MTQARGYTSARGGGGILRGSTDLRRMRWHISRHPRGRLMVTTGWRHGRAQPIALHDGGVPRGDVDRRDRAAVWAILRQVTNDLDAALELNQPPAGKRPLGRLVGNIATVLTEMVRAA